MSTHKHDWQEVSRSADNGTIEFACADIECEATKTHFPRGGGPAVAEGAPAEPRRVFGSSSSAGLVEPE